jgi:hypothetical protein
MTETKLKNQVARLNRWLKKDGEALRRTSQRESAEYGDYVLIDLHRNIIIDINADLNDLEREMLEERAADQREKTGEKIRAATVKLLGGAELKMTEQQMEAWIAENRLAKQNGTLSKWKQRRLEMIHGWTWNDKEETSSKE